ncbi:uncharacterized protein LOC134768549 [Penaeus indicus]|uniref:uncharacterized protein LOC134768549 n=1 Tax=Penaeus indicus TaxID=29960 RepID=UPI00300CAD04
MAATAKTATTDRGVCYTFTAALVLLTRYTCIFKIFPNPAGKSSCHVLQESGARVVDLRSDTLTQPSPAMKEAMMAAPLGDDVFGEDPTVIALQEKVAKLLEKEAALFVPTGTMLGGVHPRTLRNLSDGTFSLEELRQLVRGEKLQWPVTSLVCVENTHNMVGGRVLPLAWLDEVRRVGRHMPGLRLPVHMDGARLMNAVAALEVPPARLVRDCASVSVCLSKGLGAPVGS